MSLRFDDIEAFLNVAELNSVTSAAERMSLSKSVISKRVSDLERRLGVRLLYRTTRNVSSRPRPGISSARPPRPRCRNSTTPRRSSPCARTTCAANCASSPR